MTAYIILCHFFSSITGLLVLSGGRLAGCATLMAVLLPAGAGNSHWRRLISQGSAAQTQLLDATFVFSLFAPLN